MPPPHTFDPRSCWTTRLQPVKQACATEGNQKINQRLVVSEDYLTYTVDAAHSVCETVSVRIYVYVYKHVIVAFHVCNCESILAVFAYMWKNPFVQLNTYV